MIYKLLCRIGVHQWQGTEPDLPYVWVQECACCGKRRAGWGFQ